MSWRMYALLAVLYACGVEPGTRESELEPKDDRPGKVVAEEPYDPEPDAGTLASDASAQALPDSGGAQPDSAVQAPQDAQAPGADADGPTVDAGPFVALTGMWRVTLSPVGTPCAGDVVPTAQDWRVLEADGSLTVDTLQGSLTGPPSAISGNWLGRWRVTGALRAGLSGELERKGATCTDRWTLVGLRP